MSDPHAWQCPLCQTAIDGSPAELPETSAILEILFQFVEPPSDSRNFRYPSVVDLESTQLFPLAEAAEKYSVFAAMSACATAMQYDPSITCLRFVAHDQSDSLQLFDRQASIGYTKPLIQAWIQRSHATGGPFISPPTRPCARRRKAYHSRPPGEMGEYKTYITCAHDILLRNP